MFTSPYSFRQFNNPGSALLDLNLTHHLQQNQLLKKAMAAQPGGLATGPTTFEGAEPQTGFSPPVAAGIFPISFTDFVPAQHRIIPDQTASSMLGSTPQQRQELRDLYHSFLDEYERSARKYNTAYALAFLVSVGLRCCVGQELSDAEEEQLALNYNDAFANSPVYDNTPPVQKQALYESYIITAFTIGSLHAQGVENNDPNMMLQARNIAVTSLWQFAGIAVR